MQLQDQIKEEYAGQRLLAMDPRSVKPERTCPACDSDNSRVVGVKNNLDMLSCSICGTLYTSYSPWYSSSHYYADYHDHGGLSEPAFVRQRLEEITRQFSSYRQTNRLLDVGCGAGTLLLAAQSQGWDVQGVDVSPTAAQHVRSLGIEVFHGELQDAGLPSGHFDVITAGELLEHLFDPKVVVKEVARLLRPGGLFWTTTPHCRGMSARMLGLKWATVSPPEHLQLFSTTGLRTLLQSAGFHSLRLRTEGGNPIQIWRTLRPAKDAAGDAGHNSDSVAASYQLNEAFTKSEYRRVIKKTLNGLLSVTRLGDTLKVFAVK